jgi:hypothetical protein
MRAHKTVQWQKKKDPNKQSKYRLYLLYICNTYQLFLAISTDCVPYVLVTCCMYVSASVLVITRHSMSSCLVRHSSTAEDTSFISNVSTWDVEEEWTERGGGVVDCSSVIGWRFLDSILVVVAVSTPISKPISESRGAVGAARKAISDLTVLDLDLLV